MASSSTAPPPAAEKPFYDSCEYNKEPIGDVFERLLERLRQGGTAAAADSPVTPPITVLETAAGTGQHAVYLTSRFPAPQGILRWVPTDLPECLPGIYRWVSEDGKDNSNLFRGVPGAHGGAHSLLSLSFADPPERWQGDLLALTNRSQKFDVVFTANSLHIAPWEDACLHLFRRLPLVLKVGGFFLCYGAFNYNGTFTTESNRKFDAWLKRARGPHCGVRDFEKVQAALAAEGFVLDADHEMPDNNRCLQFRLLGK